MDEADLKNLEQLAFSYKKRIDQVYNGTNVDFSEGDLLTDVLHNILPKLIGNEIHYFCNPNFSPVSVFSLTLFSFQNHPEAIEWLQNKLNYSLSNCKQCVTHFVKGKSKMVEHFAVKREISHDKVSSFNELICKWRAEMVLIELRQFKIQNMNSRMEAVFTECLLNPQILRVSQELKYYYQLAFRDLYNSKHSVLNFLNFQCTGELIPGIIYCSMEGIVEELEWAKSFLRHLFDIKFQLTLSNLTSEFLDEVNYHYMYLQTRQTNPIHLKVAGLFWSRMIPFFIFMEPDVIREFFINPKNLLSLKATFKISIESVFKLWYVHLSTNYEDKPLDFLLRALKMFLEKMGPSFWAYIEPFTFHSVLDVMFDKGLFLDKLLQVQNFPTSQEGPDTWLNTTGSVSDLVMWSLPFYKTLSESKKIQMVKKVAKRFLLIISTSLQLQPIPKALLMNSATQLLNQALDIGDKERDLLYTSHNFENIIFTMADCRNLLNNEKILDMVMNTVNSPELMYPGCPTDSLFYSAIAVLASCIDFDILNLCEITYKIYHNSAINESKANDVKVDQSVIFKLINSLDPRIDAKAHFKAIKLLASLRNIHGLLILKSQEQHVLQNNQIVAKYIGLVKQLMNKCTELPTNKLIILLSDKKAIIGFWSCVFSPDQELYQEAINMLYELFDVEGRLEGIQEMFTKNLTNNLQSVNIVLAQLTRSEYYEPCPRAVRILLDIFKVFTDPVRGVFANYNSLKTTETNSSLLDFWKITWKFLDMIYRMTLKWASKYSYSDLEKFTKDTLDVSNSLVNSYREFSDILNQESTKDNDLFKNVMVPFKNMLYWLRLSDEDLLALCVKLIVTASDLAKEKQVVFDDLLITEMVRYACKARKYSNKLSEQQSSDLISRAKNFNVLLTDSIIQEAEKYHRERELVKNEPSPSTHTSNVSNYTSITTKGMQPQQRIDYLQKQSFVSSISTKPKGQSSITSFGSFKPGFFGVTARSQKPLSKLELARQKLTKDRVIHPPSHTVFHPRPLKKKKSGNIDESSSDDSDVDDANELFSISKPKDRSTPGLLDINGREIKKTKNRDDTRKLEEESMRRRLNVDLNPFYAKILKWDYTRQDEYPDEDNIGSYSDVCDQFQTPEQYQNIMEPLLLLECWQGLCAARDREDHKSFSFVVGNRTAVSDFYEVYASINKKVVQNAEINESDLIVLGHFPDFKGNCILTNNDFKKADHTCLAKIREIKNSKGENLDLTIRIHRSTKFSNFLVLREEIHAVKVMQMTTVEREYTSLAGLPYYDLVDQILKAQPSSEYPADTSEVDIVKSNYKLNTSQAEAIVSTIKKPGFSLIQGPPGTGKTKTILGIVGYFLSTSRVKQPNIIKQPCELTTSSTDELLKKQKVLLCAPSNAAVDELVLRLKEGVIGYDGALFKPNIVRIGRSDAVNAAIKDITLDELVESKTAGKSYEIMHDHELNKRFNAIVSERKNLRGILNKEDGSTISKLSTDDISKIQLQIQDLSKQINELGKQRDEIRERNSVNFRAKELDRRKMQARILAESDIICSTLSGSAHDVLSSLGVRFNTVIIDEACQCTELSSIIPLRYGGKRCIMVGDPNQLPPTVISGAASNYKYNQSLFVRMEKNYKPHLLNVQYRMHPLISRFPSLEFYNSRLKDGPGMESSTKRPWHDFSTFGPYKFFDIVTGRQKQNAKTMSYVNYDESKVAVELVDNLLKKYEATTDFIGKIGIISPYREQMQLIKKDFKQYFGSVIFKYVDFNTIDGFQGQEKEIVIISCVRADDTSTSVGFLKDFRRMNVALTRAKSSLWILGHHKSLYNNKLWRHLISDVKERGCLELACPGFMDDKNHSARELLSKYKGTHDYIQSNDTYSPSLNFKNQNRFDKKRSNDINIRNKNNLKRPKVNETSKDSGNMLGTKKKSSIFGNEHFSTNLLDSASNTIPNKQKSQLLISKQKGEVVHMMKGQTKREHKPINSDDTFDRLHQHVNHSNLSESVAIKMHNGQNSLNEESNPYIYDNIKTEASNNSDILFHDNHKFLKQNEVNSGRVSSKYNNSHLSNDKSKHIDSKTNIATCTEGKLNINEGQTCNNQKNMSSLHTSDGENMISSLNTNQESLKGSDVYDTDHRAMEIPLIYRRTPNDRQSQYLPTEGRTSTGVDMHDRSSNMRGDNRSDQCSVIQPTTSKPYNTRTVEPPEIPLFNYTSENQYSKHAEPYDQAKFQQHLPLQTHNVMTVQHSHQMSDRKYGIPSSLQSHQESGVNRTISSRTLLPSKDIKGNPVTSNITSLQHPSITTNSINQQGLQQPFQHSTFNTHHDNRSYGVSTYAPIHNIQRSYQHNHQHMYTPDRQGSYSDQLIHKKCQKKKRYG